MCAGTDAQLVMSWDTRCLHISVHDGSASLPTPREPSEERVGGRGMLLVDVLADTWEARPCPHGKTVTACFRAPGRRRGVITPAGDADPDRPTIGRADPRQGRPRRGRRPLGAPHGDRRPAPSPARPPSRPAAG